MTASTICWTEIADIDRRLDELGMSRSILTAAVESWAAGINSGTPNHPRTYGGYMGWAEAVETLRREGAPIGLEPQFYDGLEIAINRLTGAGVVVSQGTAGTGDSAGNPSTKYPRGPKSREVLPAQLTLWPAEGEETSSVSCDIWILLVYRTPLEVRAELSHALVVAEDGEITRWGERIILPRMNLDTPMSPATDLEPTDAVDVPIISRS